MLPSERSWLLLSVRECLDDTREVIHRNETAMRLGAEPIDLEPLRVQLFELLELERLLTEEPETDNCPDSEQARGRSEAIPDRPR